jgi:hypothetical protein
MADEKNNEQQIPVKRMLPCGHEDSWEHEFVTGMLDLVAAGLAVRKDPTDACMEYTRAVLAHFYMQIPTMEEAEKIMLAHQMEAAASSKGGH